MKHLINIISLLCCLQVCQAVTFHLDKQYDPFLFCRITTPSENQSDSLTDNWSFSVAWSPLYTGFGVQEFMGAARYKQYYIQWNSQLHDLMQTHRCHISFPVILLNDVRADFGISGAYSLVPSTRPASALSLSVGWSVAPLPCCRINMSAQNFFEISTDTLLSFNESILRCRADWQILKQFRLAVELMKYESCPWRFQTGFRVMPLKNMFFSAMLCFPDYSLTARISIVFKGIIFKQTADFHPKLGVAACTFFAR